MARNSIVAMSLVAAWLAGPAAIASAIDRPVRPDGTTALQVAPFEGDVAEV
jgi:hypothetical protein